MDYEKIFRTLVPFFCFVIAGSLHEFAHGLTAYLLGDDTAKRERRLTINPIAHIDPWGTIFLPLLAAFTSIPVLGWMRPVPVNSLNFKKNGKGMAITSFAGPYSNLLQALSGFILLTLYRLGLESLFPITRFSPWIEMFFYNYVSINLMLMFFNLLPFPPLDGGWILRHFLPLNGKMKYDRLYPYGIFFLYFFVLFGFGKIFSVLSQLLLLLLTSIKEIHWALSFAPLFLSFVPIAIFFFHTRKEFGTASVNRKPKKTKKNKHQKLQTPLASSIEAGNNDSAQEEKAIQLYQRLIENHPFRNEDQSIIETLRTLLQPPKGELCPDTDFLYSDSYCKNCDRYAHCLLRAIDKIRNKNYIEGS